jgi:hypothetical protein
MLETGNEGTYMRMIKSIPAIPVIDIVIAAHFYKTKMGFNITHKDEAFAILKRDEVELHLWAANDESWKDNYSPSSSPVKSGAESFIAGTASCRIEVESIQELYKEYKIEEILYNQSTVVSEKPWRTLEFEVLDLHGNLLVFYEQKKE